MGRVLPGGLGLGLVAVGLALLAGLVLGVPLPLLLLPLAPLLLLEVVLRLALVLLPTGSASGTGGASGDVPAPCTAPRGALSPPFYPVGIAYLEGLAALVLQLRHLLGHPGGDVGDGHLDHVFQQQGEVLWGHGGGTLSIPFPQMRPTGGGKWGPERAAQRETLQ